jgi:hypothetical protein
MVNVLENAVWVFLAIIMLIALGIGYSVVDRVFLSSTTFFNQTFNDLNYTNQSNPNYNLTKMVYTDRIQEYYDMRGLWLEMINFVIILLVSFIFLSSFTQNVDVVEYVYFFVASLFITAILSYLITQVYNSVLIEFTALGLSTDAFLSYFILNYQYILVLNILGFIGNVVFQKMRGRGGL